jgi:hypothetical protein
MHYIVLHLLETFLDAFAPCRVPTKIALFMKQLIIAEWIFMKCDIGEFN